MSLVETSRPRATVRAFALIAVACASAAFVSGCVQRGSGTGDSATNAPTWSKSFGGAGDDTASAAVRTADGGYLFVGSRDGGPVGPRPSRTTYATTGYSDLSITKLDAFGDPVWQSALGAARLGSDVFENDRRTTHVGTTADGGYWLVGREIGADEREDVFVSRLDAGGAILWSRTYDIASFPSSGQLEDGSPALDFDIDSTDGDVRETPTAIAETRDDGLLVGILMSADVRLSIPGGTASAEAVGTRVLKIAPNGDVNWQQPFVFRPLGYAMRAIDNLAEAADGSVYASASNTIVRLDGGRVRWMQYLSSEIVDDFYPAQGGVGLVALEYAGRAGAAALDGVVAVGTDDTVKGVFGGPGSYDAGVRRLRDDGTTDWRVELGYPGVVRAAQAACPRNAPVGTRCPTAMLVDPSPNGTASSGLVFAILQPDGQVTRARFTLPDIRRVCDFRRDPGLLLPDDRVAFRALVNDSAGRLGTLVIDDRGDVREPFTPLAVAQTCPATPAAATESDVRARFGRDGRVVQYAYLGSDASALVVSGSDGSEQLRLVYSSTTGEDDGAEHRARAVIQTDDDGDGSADDGYLVVAERIDRGTGLNGIGLLVKVDASGAVVWQRAFPEIKFGWERTSIAGRALVQTFSGTGAARRPTGYAFVARRFGGGASDDVVLVRVDATGEPVGITGAFRTRAEPIGRFLALTVATDGGFALVFGSRIVKLSATGQVEWRRSLDNVAELSAIVAAPNGYYVAGNGGLPVVTRLDAGGAVTWQRAYDLVANVQATTEGHVALDVAADGSLLLAATIEADLDSSARAATVESLRTGWRRRDLRVLGLDADGNVRWDRQLGGLEDDWLASLEATPDGGALIAATSKSLGENEEAWILRLGANGRVGPTCAAEVTGALGLSRARTVTAVSVEQPLAPAYTPLVRTTAGGLLRRVALPAASVARQCSGVASSAIGAEPPGPNTSELTVVQGGSITGVVSSVPNGILCGVSGGGACTARFTNGTRVSIQVDPAARPTFEAWTGCDDVVGTRCDVLVDRARTVTVRFATEPRPDLVALVIDSIEGRGRVVSLRGMDCDPTKLGGDACRESVGRDSTVRLTARPDPRRAFLGWGGGCASFGTATQIDFVMGEGRTCSARFDGPPATAPEVAVSIYPELPTGGAQSYTYGGNVTSTPAGIDCGTRADVCLEGFVAGTQVVLRGEATRPGWEFEGFICTGGTHVSTASTVDLGVLVSDANCQASFRPDIERMYLQMIADDGNASPARVYAEDARLDCAASCDRTFPRDIVVRLRAEPFGLHTFDGWTGCDAQPADPRGGTRPLCEVQMTARRDVRALFSRIGGGVPNNVLLVDFTPDSAGGVVTSSPAAINCRPGAGTCSAAFASGTDVVLTLAPDAGGTATSPSGCDTFTPASAATPATCAVRLTSNRTVVVRTTRANAPPVASFTFSPDVPLTGEPVTLDGGSSTDDAGIVAYRWDFTNDRTFDATGTVATATYPAAGTYTVRLQVEDADGAVAETTREIDVTAPAERVPLTVSVTGTGVGTILSLLPGINCGADCSEDWLVGTIVDLVASPAGGSSFAGWTNCPDVRTQPSGVPQCRVTMDAPRTVGAAFAPTPPQATLTLRLQGPGDGVVTYAPSTTACSKASEPTCVRTFANGTVVTLSATAYTGWRVGEWGGCDTVSADSRTCTVTMNANRTVDAFFVP